MLVALLHTMKIQRCFTQPTSFVKLKMKFSFISVLSNSSWDIPTNLRRTKNLWWDLRRNKISAAIFSSQLGVHKQVFQCQMQWSSESALHARTMSWAETFISSYPAEWVYRIQYWYSERLRLRMLVKFNVLWDVEAITKAVTATQSMTGDIGDSSQKGPF
jgi:hypothetical protein